MATDIFDAELKKKHEAKWAKAFSCEDDSDGSSFGLSRKATIVIEQYVPFVQLLSRCVQYLGVLNLHHLLPCHSYSLIRTSDVSHTMQYWQMYKVRAGANTSVLFRALIR
jgi:hypothetical protein